MSRKRVDRLSSVLGRVLCVGAAALLAWAFVRRRSRRAERQNPPEGRLIVVRGVRLHCVELGRGEPLVLLHGLGTMGQDFLLSAVVQQAAQRYRVMVFDRPGYGHSGGSAEAWLRSPLEQARLFHEALQQLGVTRAMVLGHSWGALVAAAWALEQPRSVRSLVLAAGGYYPTLNLQLVLFSTLAIPVVGDLLRHTFAPLLVRALWPFLVARLFQPQPVSPTFWRYPVWMTLRPSQLRATAGESARTWEATTALSDRYRSIAAPVVIVAGGGDRVLDPSEQSQRLHAELPGSDLRIIDGAGHMLQHIAPADLLAAIDAAARRADVAENDRQRQTANSSL